MVGATASFKKGMIVKVKPAVDYSDHIKTDWETGEVICEDIWRDRTEAEHEAWLASDASKGMNCAGESKLDSPTRYRVPKTDEVFKVVRARVKARRGWNTIPGCAEVEDTSGVRWYVKRAHLH
jgi:hypothetical protein